VGNAGQHGKRAATREGSRNCAPDQQQTHVHQQTRQHLQQKSQLKEHSWQEPGTQQQKQGGIADKKQKGSRSHGMQKRRTSTRLKESTCSARRTRSAATVSPDKRSKRSSHKSVGSVNMHAYNRADSMCRTKHIIRPGLRRHDCHLVKKEKKGRKRRRGPTRVH
jgi:hypothetical protein